MDIEVAAQVFVDYLKSVSGFTIVDYFDGNYDHMGATIADAILQSGLKYDSVVRPRIKKIREIYPQANTTSAFLKFTAVRENLGL